MKAEQFKYNVMRAIEYMWDRQPDFDDVSEDELVKRLSHRLKIMRATKKVIYDRLYKKIMDRRIDHIKSIK